VIRRLAPGILVVTSLAACGGAATVSGTTATLDSVVSAHDLPLAGAHTSPLPRSHGIVVEQRQAPVAPPTTPREPEPPTTPVTCTTYTVTGALFASGSWELTQDGLADIQLLASTLRGVPGVEIHGYTDTDPIAMGNHRLSELRAQAVADALVAAGLPPDLIRLIEGHGSSGAKATNDTEEGKALNRRVEVEVEC
jgi:outer membrane protein OmpA-like peptidoglycan-associated protein